ncbi:hypothetical protein BYT27DRAFT_7188650 [Phlegmacium glaucopus]|nr:hypothetical protein BYT27DRAFT_7188650 [Phlegmacium glaucopus]
MIYSLSVSLERGEPSKAEITWLTLRGGHPKLMKGDIEWIQTLEMSTILHGSETTFLDDDGQVFDNINLSAFLRDSSNT